MDDMDGVKNRARLPSPSSPSHIGAHPRYLAHNAQYRVFHVVIYAIWDLQCYRRSCEFRQAVRQQSLNMLSATAS